MNLILIEIASVIGGLGTFLFSQQKGVGVVKASALLSLIVGIAAYSIPVHPVVDQVAFAFCGTTFVGMSSPTVLNKYWIVAASILYGALFYFFAFQFEGFGGGLGTTACISTVSVFGIKKIVEKQKGTN